MRTRRAGIVSGTALSAAVLSVAIFPSVAFAAESQYANNTPRDEFARVYSGTVGTHTGGRGWVSGTASGLHIGLETRNVTTYAVIYSADGNYGGPVTLTHAATGNTWSSCYWYYDDGKTTSGSLGLTCWRRY